MCRPIEFIHPHFPFFHCSSQIISLSGKVKEMLSVVGGRGKRKRFISFILLTFLIPLISFVGEGKEDGEKGEYYWLGEKK